MFINYHFITLFHLIFVSKSIYPLMFTKEFAFNYNATQIGSVWILGQCSEI